MMQYVCKKLKNEMILLSNIMLFTSEDKIYVQFSTAQQADTQRKFTIMICEHDEVQALEYFGLSYTGLYLFMTRIAYGAKRLPVNRLTLFRDLYATFPNSDPVLALRLAEIDPQLSRRRRIAAQSSMAWLELKNDDKFASAIAALLRVVHRSTGKNSIL